MRRLVTLFLRHNHQSSDAVRRKLLANRCRQVAASGTAVPSGDSGAGSVTSSEWRTSDSRHGSVLKEFFGECDRLGEALGRASQRDKPHLVGELNDFWADRIESAVASCTGARDFSFVASRGLCHTTLAMSGADLATAVELLVRDEETCSARDFCVAIRYVAREMARVDATSSDGANTKKVNYVKSALHKYFADIGVRALRSRYFISEASYLGSGQDAIHAIEFVLSAAGGHPDEQRVLEVLLHVVGAKANTLRMTSIISGIAQLRICTRKVSQEHCVDVFLQLLRAVKRSDAKLINDFHFVKILATLSCLDLSLLPRNGMWEYLVSKACIFLVNASPTQGQYMVYTLRQLLRDAGKDSLALPLAREIKASIPHRFDTLMADPIPALRRRSSKPLPPGD